MTDNNKYKPLTLEDKIPFGKHRGKSIAVISLRDINYLKWLNWKDSNLFNAEVKAWINELPSKSKWKR